MHLNPQELLEKAQKAIQKGERCRILYELLLEQLEMTYKDNGQEVFKKLYEVENQYQEAVKDMGIIIKEQYRNNPKEEGGVSVSNY